MSSKRISSQSAVSTQNKKSKLSDSNNYLQTTLHESGLSLKHSPEKCVATQETVHIIRSIKKNLEKHFEYPRNVADLFSDLVKECKDLVVFKHYLFPNIVRLSEDSGEEYPVADSVFKILLSVPILQDKLSEFIFEKAIDLAASLKCGPWIQMILKCFSSLDSIVNLDKMSTNLINLLDVAEEKMVKLEIITAIPDIIGDQEHDNIAAEMSRILSEDHDLIPAILDCLSYLCLSDDKYEQLQTKSLSLLLNLSRCNHFPNFVKFLLLPGRMSETAYLEAVQGLRNCLGWSTTGQHQEIATSQVLTSTAIRNSIISSKVIGNCWLKVLSSCKDSSDHKPIDFVLMLVLYSTSEEKQRLVENLLRKQIKLNIFKNEMLNETFKNYKSILKEYLRQLLDLSNSLLKTKADSVIVDFASYIYTLMFEELEECCQTIVAELLQLCLDSKQCVMSILLILNKVASKDMSLLKPQCVQMLTLLDRMDDMPLAEVRAVMNLLCGLAYSYENSFIRDDIHMIIKKELGSSNLTIKVQGILGATHAVKYLMVASSDDDETRELSDDVSYGSVTHLSEGDLREAAQMIELISRSTRQFPDMIAFFYDELSQIISAATIINKHFLSWLTDAVTNDLQQNFIVDTIETDRIGEIKLSMQYCLNADSEMDEVIAINVAGLTLKSSSEINIAILSPLFQLVQTLHSKQSENNLSSIDALLGCPVVMPKFDIDVIEEMDSAEVTKILDCLIHCINWFRELLNAFASQVDEDLKKKTLKRVLQIEELEKIVLEILIKTKIMYKPPICTFNISKYTGEQVEHKPVKVLNSKQKTSKKAVQDDTALPETIKSQATQNNLSVKSSLEVCHNIPLRQLNLNLLHLIRMDMTDDKESESKLTVKMLIFLLKSVNSNIENILISKIKRKTFLTKQENVIYDAAKAEECAKSIGEVLPKLMEHLKCVTSFLDKSINENINDIGISNTSEIIDNLTCLEYIYNINTIFFKWIGFKNQKHNSLLRSSLRTIASPSTPTISLKDLLIAVAEFLQKHEKYCLQLSTAVSLMEFLKSIQNYSENRIVLNILRNLAKSFLSKQWKTLDGHLEKGLYFNQCVDRLASIYFINNEVIALKNLTLQLSQEIKDLNTRTSTLSNLKCINKSNFSILYRNLGTAVHDATKARLDKGMTNSEHLELWRDVATILKNMSEIAKTLETRNNLSVFFKKSLPVLKLFQSQGIPILEIQLKNDTKEVLEILKILQQSTRFLQTLCCHSRLKKDTVLMSKVPHMRQLLETLIYKVKAALAANKCSGAFWMGNLKNKDIHGEVIASQQSVEDEELGEDCDEQLPEDDNTDESDDEMINPESRSISDIV